MNVGRRITLGSRAAPSLAVGFPVAIAIVVVVVGVAGLARPARADVRWRGDFETGDLSQWSYVLNARGLSVVATPVADGRHAGRVEIRKDDLWPNGLNRVELQHKPAASTETEGAEGTYAWSLYLPAVLTGARHQIGYWESDKSYKQVMGFEARGATIAFVTRMPAEKVQWTGAGLLTAKTWHRIALHVKWSRDPAVGFVDVWFDGKPVVTHAGARTLWDNPAFLQIGILRDVPGDTEEMFVDAAAEGTTVADVADARPAAAGAPPANARGAGTRSPPSPSPPARP